MKKLRSILTVVMCSLLMSCATPALWDATNPREFVAVRRSKVNESELKDKGLAYKVDPKGVYLYVEKTRLQKAGDYAIRTLGTPVTVVIDAVGTTIVVVGVVGALFIYGAGQQSISTGEPVIIY